MIGRPLVRRRPLLRAAAVGGTFAAGRAMGRRAEQRDANAAEQDERVGAPEANQAQPQAAPQGGPRGAAGQAAPPQGGGAAQPSTFDQLSQLTTLHDQGALTDEEFAAAKAKVLGS
jgi:Short C-terminal domain